MKIEKQFGKIFDEMQETAKNPAKHSVTAVTDGTPESEFSEFPVPEGVSGRFFLKGGNLELLPPVIETLRELHRQAKRRDLEVTSVWIGCDSKRRIERRKGLGPQGTDHHKRPKSRAEPRLLRRISVETGCTRTQYDSLDQQS
jgi:hypothetical protein